MKYILTRCCSSAIDLTQRNITDVICPTCGKKYAITTDVDFAEASTGSWASYKWSDDGNCLVRYYFHNYTLEYLGGIAEAIKIQDKNETRPYKLLPIFKSMHD